MNNSESPNPHSGMSDFPLPIRIVVYPSEDTPGYLVAHCLEFDLIGMGLNLEEAMIKLVENMAAQSEACEENETRIYFPAPEWVSGKYLHAKTYGRKIPEELIERVLRTVTNNVETVVATGEVTEDHLLAPA